MGPQATPQGEAFRPGYRFILAVTLAAVVLVSGAVAQNEPVTAESPLAIVSVADKDGTAVTAAITALVARAVAEGRRAPILLPAGDKVIVWGVRADREAAATVLAALPPRPIPESRVVRLRFFRDPTKLIEVIASVKTRVAPDVKVTGFGTADTPAGLLLCGPPAQVAALRGQIALLDVPVPQMWLELWSIQISGRDPKEVTRQAAEAQQKIAKARQVVTDYLWLLELYAREEQRGNLDRLHLDAQAKREALSTALATVVNLGTTGVAPDDVRAASTALRQALQDAGRAEALAAERATTLGTYRAPLSAILSPLAQAPPPEGQTRTKQFETWLSGLVGKTPGALSLSRCRQWLVDRGKAGETLAPTALFDAFDTLHRPGNSGLKSFLELDLRAQGGQEAPEALALATASAQVELAEYERALNEDTHRLFLKPLLIALRKADPKARTSGLSSVGCASIVVVSGATATVEGAAVSYFDVTQPPTVPPEILAAAFSGSLPQIAALLAALATPNQTWSAMTEGASIEFKPVVLPGGAMAEVAIEATIAHNDPGTTNEEAAQTAVPLTRVARHCATTKIMLEPLDLFALSTFGLSTTHPRPDTVIPILGQIPFLGQMFRFPRSPQRIHHESLLLVYSVISPMTSQLAEVAAVDREAFGLREAGE
jgi:hypothetical protein